MNSARRLLLVAALALAIASSDARWDSTDSVLTLSPTSDSLITGRGDSVSSGGGGTVIGTAATATKAPATEAPATETPKDTPAPAPPSSDESSPSTSNSGSSNSASEEQDVTDTPSGASATVGPNTSEDQSSTTKASTSTSTSASKSTASVDSLNDSTGTLTSGNKSELNMSVGVPAILGALACVGAIVMAVTYKKKQEADADDKQRLSDDCEYTGGANFTPGNRALNTVIEEDTPPPSSKQGNADITSASGSIADFTRTNSSSSISSPFGSHHCKARVSSPVPSCYSISEMNTEFQDSGVRDNEGSNVVLTIEEVATTGSSQGAPQVQL
ncbi:hypothetical protein PHYBOEH_002134 [Phytophthora boehmeriae]|uniref:Uncharacterized protein n=1 Tax=Phytophthora boehmeriae TaxID=109152 RepID=A0A8T1WXP2_9STRA|nr:hypothetical protein PHYBOEH_002134 [Phytophthora boehmeriae]